MSMVWHSTFHFLFRADFTPLLTSPSVELKLEIRNAAKQKVGLLMLKAMWML